MRRMTVRVQEGDWLVRAEKPDGQMLFEVEFSEDGTTPAPAVAASPEPASPPTLPAIAHDEEYERELDAAIKAFGKNMPQGPALSRVVEIGGFMGEMTKRLHRLTEGDRAEPVYMVDPFLGRTDNEAVARPLLALNVASISPRTIPGSASEAAGQMAPMNVDLLCVSAQLSTCSLASLADDWLRHLSQAGIVLGRFPKAPVTGDMAVKELGDLFTRQSLEVTRLTDEWFMATRTEVKA